MLTIGINVDLKPVHQALLHFGQKQVTFAAAMALTKLAQGVSAQETIAVTETFKSPTPFTQKGFQFVPATKVTLASLVMARPIANQYLAPYVFGGPRFLGDKRAMLVPEAVGTNRYGNLPKDTLKQLKSMKDVFIGPVKFKDGTVINGVWQRGATPRGDRRKSYSGGYGTKGANVGKNTAAAIAGQRTTLKLLIRFEDTTPAPTHLPFMERAEAYVKAMSAREFRAALKYALAGR